jgi:hypothetical protein
MVIGWLIDRDAKKREVAVSILTRLGPPAVSLLVGEASKPGRRAEHCIAILDVVQQIGGLPEPSTMFGLQSLLGHGSPSVREQAERTIMSMSPAGIPDSPAGIAMMRAFNPFLQAPPRRRPPRRSRLADFTAALQGDPAAIRRRIRSSAARQKREEGEQGRMP